MQTELHRHLDVAARPETMLVLAQERGLTGQSTSLEAFSDRLIIREPMSDLATVLSQFTLFQQVLDRPEVLDQVAFEAVEDCYREGTRAVELRWSPSFVCDLSKLPWDHALDGFEAGIRRALERYPDMRAGMLCIVSRDYPMTVIERTVEFFLKHQERFVGLDLAGPEKEFPARAFESVFQRARDQGARITAHAGEAAGPESIWEAIESLGASRIGHGIACVEDPHLMEYLARERICLEMCPTSNWLTGCISDFSDHVLPQVLRAGVPVCINTDDPGIFGVSLPHEIEICRTRMGLSDEEIRLTFAHASRASFLT